MLCHEIIFYECMRLFHHNRLTDPLSELFLLRIVPMKPPINTNVFFGVTREYSCEFVAKGALNIVFGVGRFRA